MVSFGLHSKSVFALLAIAAVSATNVEAKPILVVSRSGILTGAKNVDILGVGLYDVTFVADVCANVYGACDIAHFPFNEPTSALNASIALDQQVFQNGPKGDFDSNPGLTAGCTAPFSSTVCGFVTPYGFNGFGFGPGGSIVPTWLQGYAFENAIDGYVPPDREFYVNSSAFYDQKVYEDHYVFAKWSKSAPVPEPSGLVVMASGLLALAGMALQKKFRQIRHLEQAQPRDTL